ncbi:unnamed protein product [Microthlaspi erraticum]|uniref:Arabidopsis retrotransposon Orf1 C-terminal domain-containing protein n=1 Tax=Microthlaspi erraticum TaxID=1685480 RepID=A0A6D2J8D9_9BRAS|nr:unnamed protein product [Microthlaspi erraticum]
MRIEGEKGVKTQSAPKHWPRTRKENFGRAISNLADRHGRAGKECVLGRIDLSRDKTFAHARTGKEGRDRPKFCIGTDRPCRSIRETNDRPRPKSLGHENLADQIARPRQNRPSAKTFLGQEHVESPTRGEDDWALVTFVGEQNQDPRKCKKAMEKVNIEPCVKMDTQTLDLLKIRDDVTWYIRKLGLSKLFKLECSEYSQLTKEFLSTVALAFPNHNGDQPAGDGLLLFKIGDANGRISSQLYANSLDFPMRQHMTSRRTQRGNKLPLLIGHTLPMNHSCLQGQRCLESPIQPFAMCTASSPPLSNANKKPTRSQLMSSTSSPHHSSSMSTRPTLDFYLPRHYQCEEASSRLGRQQEALCSFWEAYHGHSTACGD